MTLYEDIKEKNEKIAVIGLGYVGMPLVIAFAKVAEVIAFDILKEKVLMYQQGIDVTKEVGDKAVKQTSACFTWDECCLKDTRFHIVAVPTPIYADKTPNLMPVISASKTIGRNLSRGSIVVYESTVYPGLTEEICIPILEKESGLVCGIDFKVGYSPERINPGDSVNRLESIVKVVSGIDEIALQEISNIYGMIIKAGVYKAMSIKVAEAAKVIENAQRDINIAFMNELSIIFNKLGIDTKAVLEAAATKWNFLKFSPGLVGGHCIGVDPYYLTHKAEMVGYHSQIILSGRKINDYMGKYVAEHTVKSMIKAKRQVNGARVAVLGITFKENCQDSRNTKVVDIIRELEEYGIQVMVADPVADKLEVKEHYGIEMQRFSDIHDVDAVVMAVAHDAFTAISLDALHGLYRANAWTCHGEDDVTEGDHKLVLIDVKGIYSRVQAEQMNFLYWRL